MVLHRFRSSHGKLSHRPLQRPAPRCALRYRELIKELTTSTRSSSQPGGHDQSLLAADPADQIRRVTVTVVGQAKTGKSSLINALLGQQRAIADVLPATDAITRYELQPPGIPTRLVLLDTVGYAHAGPTADQLKATQNAAQQSDLLLFIGHARNPARQADREILQALQRWFAARPHLKRPPILGVLTHIDLLSPVLEWSSLQLAATRGHQGAADSAAVAAVK